MSILYISCLGKHGHELVNTLIVLELSVILIWIESMLDGSWFVISLYILSLGKHCHELGNTLIVLEFL
jgi:hypothetical protein